ncbi:MAG TPA: CHAD domain-containing protein [Solirubrobacteraceae bacterium]|nr:CHAD domain-containing protein [Solirubrobacteraceae bacterium]
MAKARDIPGLESSAPFARAAGEAVSVRGQELFDHAADVLDTQDIERVHDMRVASRRLRAVLEIFAPCFPRDQHKAVLREVKALADALGARRDPDVQLAGLEKMAGALRQAEQPGLRVLTEQLRTEQEEGNRTLARALEHARQSDLPARVRALALAALDEAGGAEADGPGAPGPEAPETLQGDGRGTEHARPVVT